MKSAGHNTCIDLFAGAGGLSLGLATAGFSCLYANEVVPAYAETFARNHKGTVVETADIRSLDPAEIRRTLNLDKGELSLIVGGPPCQGFSINAPQRSAEDERNTLFVDYLRFVSEFEPRAVLIENVPGLVSFERGATLRSILDQLEGIGYHSRVQILYAPDFGVPQTRWRTVIVAFKDRVLLEKFRFPKPRFYAPARVNFTSSLDGKPLIDRVHDGKLHRHVSAVDALDDLPVIMNGQCGDGLPYRFDASNEFQRQMRRGSRGVTNHHAPRLGSLNMKRLRYIPQGGNWTDIPVALLPKGMKKARRSDHTKRYGRVNPDGLASTILTKCDPHWGAFFHYSQDRCFTVREAARLQTFPDHYIFTGSRSQQYEQVGNAVPPLLAAEIGAAVGVALESDHAKLLAS